MQPFVIIGIFVGFDFLDHQTERASQRPHVHLVHVLAAGRFQKALQHRPRDRVGRQFRGFAAVSDDQLVVAFGRNLRQQTA